MSKLNKYDLLERILGDLLIENKSLTTEQAYHLIEIMVVKGMDAYAHTFQKELTDAGITTKDLATKLLTGKLAGVDILRRYKIEPRRAIQIISHCSIVEINQLNLNFVMWTEKLISLTKPRMINNIRAETVRADLINILQNKPSTLIFDEAELNDIKILKTSIIRGINGMDPVELIQQIFDEDFIRSCDRKSIEAVESQADSILIQNYLSIGRTMATPVTLDPDKIVVDKLNLIYEKEYAGKNHLPIKPLACPTAPASSSVNMIARTQPTVHNSFDDNSMPIITLAAGTVLGYLVALPLYNYARRGFSCLFWQNPPSPSVEDEVSLINNETQRP